MRVIVKEAVIGEQISTIADFTFDAKYCPWVQYIEDTTNPMHIKRYRLEFYPSQEGEIDYRQLLKAYLIRVGDREGVSFIENQIGDTVRFTKAEIAELHRLSDD